MRFFLLLMQSRKIQGIIFVTFNVCHEVKGENIDAKQHG